MVLFYFPEEGRNWGLGRCVDVRSKGGLYRRWRSCARAAHALALTLALVRTLILVLKPLLAFIGWEEWSQHTCMLARRAKRRTQTERRLSKSNLYVFRVVDTVVGCRSVGR